jgi:hypothetical protein
MNNVLIDVLISRVVGVQNVQQLDGQIDAYDSRPCNQG